MKRLPALLFAAVLACLLCGCAKTAESAPTLLLRCADNQPKDYPTTRAAEHFASLVEERTGGRVVIRVFPDAVLGSEKSVFEQMQFGGIDFARVSVGTLAEQVPEAEMLQLPYLFRDADHMWRVLDGAIGDELLLGMRRADVIGLSWFDAGARNIYTREPVSSLQELKGLTIRVQESALMSEMIRLWGAVPVQMVYSEVYSALETGRIDGAENNWPSYETTGHFEAAPYYLLDGHARLPEVLLVSEVALEKITALDESYRDVIIQCAREAAVYERELWKEREAASEALVRENGCVVTELAEEELQKFRDAAAPLYASFPPETQALIERIQNA
ncbi:MAG: TRAP transporter substrate-binding protein [Oscillospiraceae bacterium]|nr:TRAP transporter substrate-binding protein [Oscillospiraceae bacterium]